MEPAKKIAESVSKLVEILAPLTAEERKRAISAALTVFGDEAAQGGAARLAERVEPPATADGLNPKAEAWLRKNGIEQNQLEQVFAIDANHVDLIAANAPGESDRERALNAYVLTGVRSFLLTGNLTFGDAEARDMCKKLGCYDKNNHSAYMKAFGNALAGNKDSGWRLTNPGLALAASILKKLAPSSDA